jgi:hypothetical protein
MKGVSDIHMKSTERLGSVVNRGVKLIGIENSARDLEMLS